MSEKYNIPEPNSLDSMEGVAELSFNDNFQLKDLSEDPFIVKKMFESINNPIIANRRERMTRLEDIGKDSRLINSFIHTYDEGLFNDFGTENFVETEEMKIESTAPFSHPAHLFGKIKTKFFDFSKEVSKYRTIEGFDNKLDLSPDDYLEYAVFLAVENIPQILDAYNRAIRNKTLFEETMEKEKKEAELLANSFFHESVRFYKIYLDLVSKLLIIFSRDEKISFKDLSKKMGFTSQENVYQTLTKFSQDSNDSALGSMHFLRFKPEGKEIGGILEALKELDDYLESIQKCLESEIINPA